MSGVFGWFCGGVFDKSFWQPFWGQFWQMFLKSFLTSILTSVLAKIGRMFFTSVFYKHLKKVFDKRCWQMFIIFCGRPWLKCMGGSFKEYLVLCLGIHHCTAGSVLHNILCPSTWQRSAYYRWTKCMYRSSVVIFNNTFTFTSVEK